MRSIRRLHERQNRQRDVRDLRQAGPVVVERVVRPADVGPWRRSGLTATSAFRGSASGSRSTVSLSSTTIQSVPARGSAQRAANTRFADPYSGHVRLSGSSTYSTFNRRN